MAVSIVKYKLTEKPHNLYDVTYYEDKIHTLVTHSPLMVDSWISDIHRIHRQCLQGLIVGLDTEWRPRSNPVATIQLCVGRKCLIFQIIHAVSIPQSLIDFLSNVNYTFVGVKIDKDAEKLMKDYGLKISNATDLCRLAVDKLPDQNLGQNPGLKVLTKVVLGKDIEKGKSISCSNWDDMTLTEAQVQYACLDAFVSFQIGRRLINNVPHNSLSATQKCLIIAAGIIAAIILPTNHDVNDGASL